MLILILMFSFSIFVLHIFFGQIWSQNRKFFKFAEILCSDTLLYAYYDFHVYFIEVFVIYIF